MENFLEGLASLTQDIRHLVNGTLVRHPQQQEERLIITTANDNTRLRDVADSETAAYFQRWAKSVLEDTERLVSTHKRQQRMNRLKSSGAKQSVNMLLDEEMLIEMDSYLSSRQFRIGESETDLCDAESISNRQPINATEVRNLLRRQESHDNGRELLRQVFYRGIEKNDRREIWPLLLDLYPLSLNEDERLAILESHVQEYRRLRKLWGMQSMDDETRAKLSLIEKDVVRTDRTLHGPAAASRDSLATSSDHGSLEYIMRELDNSSTLRDMREILMTYSIFQSDIGYVQGMNDILSPFMRMFGNVEGGNALVFCLYQRFMNHCSLNNFCLKDNFSTAQNGMRFRLILLTYTLRLLEPGFYRRLEEMDERSEEDATTIGGASGLLWAFRGVLLVWKRELTTTNPDDGSLDFDKLERLWEAYICGRRLWTPIIDVWLAYSILKLHIIPLVTSGWLTTFESLLKQIHSLDGANVIVEDVLQEMRRSMIRFERIARELLSADSNTLPRDGPPQQPEGLQRLSFTDALRFLSSPHNTVL